MIYSTKIMDFIQNELNNNASLFVETPFYDRDPELRKSDLVYEYTKEEIHVLKEIASTILAFVQFCKIQTSFGVQNISLYEYQKEYLKFSKENRFVVCLASRQTGKTILEAIDCMYNLLSGKKILLYCNKRDSGIEILDKIKNIYRNLPFFMKPGIRSWNQTSITFDNGGTVAVAYATKTKIQKGFDVVYLDEAARIPYNYWKDIANYLFPMMEETKDGRIVITSTPNGYDHFYKLYTEALNGLNNFKPFKIHWSEVPGRDDEWKEKEISNLGSEEIFDQEYDLKFINIYSETNKSNQNIKTLTERIEALESLVAQLLKKE